MATAHRIQAYLSVTGVHASALLFAAFFLPSSTRFIDIPVDPSQLSSKDRPQPTFLDPITRNPAVTLLSLCAGAVITQAWFAGWIRQWWIDAFIRGSDDELRAKKKLLNDKKLSNIFSAILSTIMASFLLCIFAMFFGAPLLEHVGKTYLLSLLLAIQTVFIPAYVLGAPTLSNESVQLSIRMAWVRLFSEFQIRNPLERAMVFPFFGSLIGAWVGIIPIALDWDRPWQAWPITPAYGSILGNILASLCAATTSLLLKPWPQ